jgi:hypothetical protein
MLFTYLLKMKYLDKPGVWLTLFSRTTRKILLNYWKSVLILIGITQESKVWLKTKHSKMGLNSF